MQKAHLYRHINLWTSTYNNPRSKYSSFPTPFLKQSHIDSYPEIYNFNRHKKAQVSEIFGASAPVSAYWNKHASPLYEASGHVNRRQTTLRAGDFDSRLNLASARVNECQYSFGQWLKKYCIDINLNQISSTTTQKNNRTEEELPRSRKFFLCSAQIGIALEIISVPSFPLLWLERLLCRLLLIRGRPPNHW